MAKFLGVVKLGTLYYGGSPQSLPTKPWLTNSYPSSLSDKGNGNILLKDSSLSNYKIGNTYSDENTQLKWIKIKDGNKILLICDRVILTKVSWTELKEEGYLEGKEITIDGNKYLCRLPTGGKKRRNGESELGGFPSNNEWDKFICNEDNIRNLPIPTTNTSEEMLKYEDFNGEHNQLWNWWGVRSWCKELCEDDRYKSSSVVRGYETAKFFDYCVSTYHFNSHGWRPILETINIDPTISDVDKNLGDKHTGFNISYNVNDLNNDSLTVIEKLNNTTLRTLNNAPKNETITINITDSMLYQLPLNKENKITIKVDDGNGSIAYRNYTFTRTNTAPIISGQDRELGVVDRTVKQSYTVHDEENDSINIVESLDDIKLKSFKAEPNKEYEISIPTSTWITLKNGQHKLTVNATDSNNATSIRTYTFEKKETKINLSLKNVLKIDDRANKILITPVWKNIDLANVKVEVCNNALDTNPTWEECTKEVMSNKHYAFNNKNKTADKWGINIRFNIEKKEGVTEEIYFNGFGGAFE